jgi:hypothetical protein
MAECPKRLTEAIWGGEEKAGRDSRPFRLMFTNRWKGAQYRPFHPCGNEEFLTKFPQASTGLSKANLDRCFTRVNLPQPPFASMLSNIRARAENEGE